MDGFQRKMMRSLQFRLSMWLTLVILVVALAAGSFSFVSAFDEAIELQDNQLRQMTALFNRLPLPITHAEIQKHDAGSNAESIFAIQPLRKSNSPESEPAGELPGLPVGLPDGFQTVTVHDLSWRVFVRTLTSGSRIAVGQRTDERDEVAQHSGLLTLLPFLTLIPTLLLLVSVLIRRAFRPLKRLASEIDARSEQDMREIPDTNMPTEIHPFVVAINHLLSRVAQSMAVQRRFVADAAHELRSPLTALSLQAERLEAADMSTEARKRLGTLQSGLHRTRMLLNQLLALARAQEAIEAAVVAVSIQQVLRHVLEDLMPLAEAKQIDLGVVGDADAWVAAHEVDLKILIKNLVDNAIRYTPVGGRVDVSVQANPGYVIMHVDDSGPGIAEHERERVFDPFYRGMGNDEAGSGLGLSIVKTIATRIGVEIILGPADANRNNSGLRVTVKFPTVRPGSVDQLAPRSQSA